MNPKKIDYINKAVAETLNVDKDLVQTVNDIFWARAKEAVNNMENNELYIHSIGSFMIKDWKINSFKNYYSTIIERLEAIDYHEHYNCVHAKDRLAKVLEVEKRYNNKKTIKQSIKNGHIQDMEEQGEDL